MLRLKANKTTISIPNAWNELRLKDWIWMLNKMGEYGLRDEIDEELSDDDKDLEEARRSVEWMKCSQEILSYLGKQPMDFIKQIHQSDVVQIINGLQWFAEAEKPEEEISYFELKGEKYFFPKANMQDSTFEDFIETSQLDVLNKNLELGRMSVVAEQMAILCRKKGETFDDVNKVMDKRKKQFNELKMDVVWNFFFFLTGQVDTLKKSFPTFLKRQ